MAHDHKEIQRLGAIADAVYDQYGDAMSEAIFPSGMAPAARQNGFFRSKDKKQAAQEMRAIRKEAAKQKGVGFFDRLLKTKKWDEALNKAAVQHEARKQAKAKK